jgi:hypothetical protein
MANPAQFPEPDQRFDAENLTRAGEEEWLPLDDEMLARIADESFLKFDAFEAKQTNHAEQCNESSRRSNEISDHE